MTKNSAGAENAGRVPRSPAALRDTALPLLQRLDHFLAGSGFSMLRRPHVGICFDLSIDQLQAC
jgi:hypothetical protein